MSKADFEYMLNKKIEAGTLYYTTFYGKLVCNRCNYRGAWTDTCRKFNKKIKKNKSGKWWLSSRTLSGMLEL